MIEIVQSSLVLSVTAHVFSFEFLDRGILIDIFIERKKNRFDKFRTKDGNPNSLNYVLAFLQNTRIRGELGAPFREGGKGAIGKYFNDSNVKRAMA